MTLTLEMLEKARDAMLASTNYLPDGEYYIEVAEGLFKVIIPEQPEWVDYLRSRGIAVRYGAWY